MTETDDKEIQKLLKEAFPPVNAELDRDLWPAMLRKLESRRFRLPWYDWALLGASAGVLAFVPKFILLFAYYF